MNKKILIIGIILVVIIVLGINFFFTNRDENVQIDMQKLLEELINSQIFEDDLSQVDKDTIIKKYNFNNEKIKDITSYVGTGATAEEILILEMLDKNDIEETEKIIETKIEERKEDFQNYLPKEVFKLENYNLENKGNYIILCISNDYNKAKDIIDKNS